MKLLLRSAQRFVGERVLPYVEVHLTDHCNLNCRGCGHFSPVASKWFVDIGRLSRDLHRLSRLFDSIRVIRLMGGEPLLHDRVIDAIAETRKYFPHSDLRLVTNGILLPRMKEDFWRACREHRVALDLTRYPISIDIDRLRELASQASVKLNISRPITEFFCNLNLEGNSDPYLTLRRCRWEFYCPALREGKLYVCMLPAVAHHFNAAFGRNLPTDGGIDIHGRLVTGRWILARLEHPVPACRYCTQDEAQKFAWGISKRTVSEWDRRQIEPVLHPNQ